ncbi:unnamed protein product [Arabidopsis lyrata]|uniref:uncharacterized protein LOC9310687 n=1 Tax=Arabidopsis lyrata subsp. lyrata TaxID=81972 RepID=UPI000A29B3B2|nr:uncharacterized protein LOC9310687 [Arabidopsis lyrata subsp. lyrata]CAH8272824.1 unnamed protein product [Arabidopsis lyrata]|eukprot:XP_020878688.1 uncharacterized protein LOC9310687 [Arabidopsis lyrata subsp. lyrata]
MEIVTGLARIIAATTTTMAFSPNPLSLSVLDPAFESWLRDSSYLELLDHRTSAAAAAASSSASVSSSAAATSAASDDEHPLPVVFSLLFCLDASLSLLFLQLTLSPSSPMIFPEIRHRGPPVSLAIVTLIRFQRLLSKRELEFMSKSNDSLGITLRYSSSSSLVHYIKCIGEIVSKLSPLGAIQIVQCQMEI